MCLKKLSKGTGSPTSESWDFLRPFGLSMQLSKEEKVELGFLQEIWQLKIALIGR